MDGSGYGSTNGHPIPEVDLEDRPVITTLGEKRNGLMLMPGTSLPPPGEGASLSRRRSVDTWGLTAPRRQIQLPEVWECGVARSLDGAWTRRA